MGKKVVAMVILALVASLALGGCAGRVSQEEYDVVCSQLARVQAQNSEYQEALGRCEAINEKLRHGIVEWGKAQTDLEKVLAMSQTEPRLLSLGGDKCTIVYARAYSETYDACVEHKLPVNCNDLALQTAETEWKACFEGLPSPYWPNNWD
jgi:hypothetical protein